MARFTTTVSAAIAATYNAPHENAARGICGARETPGEL